MYFVSEQQLFPSAAREGSATMTAVEILLVRESLNRILPVSNASVYIFFSTLYELEPELKGILSIDPASDERKYFGLMLYLITLLDDQHSFQRACEDFGLLCRRKGLRGEHIGTIAAALHSTLEQTLRSAFSGGARAAWEKLIASAVYSLKIGYSSSAAGSVTASSAPDSYSTTNNRHHS